MPGGADTTRYDVAIAGGSFAGLALARGLLQALGPDVRIAIVDRSAAPAAPINDGRAFAVWAGAKATLDSLGVWSAIANVAQPLTSIEISDSVVSDGIKQTRLTYDAKTESGEPAAFMVPASVLSEALRASIADRPSITWIAPAEAETLTLGERGARIGLRDGRVIEAALCVAADGKTSKLRDAAGIKTVGHGYEQTGIVATVAFSEPHDGVAIQHFFPGGPFAILPLQNNRACITWSAARSDAERVLALDDAAFQAELDMRIGGRFGAVSLAGPRQSWPLDIVLPRALIARRFVLMGDAAHGVHPVAGQGVNLALRDAAALIEVLSDAARVGGDFGDGVHLERYQRWRRFDSLMSASIYDGINRVFGVDDMMLRAGRGAALGLVDRLGAVKKTILAEAAGLTGELPKLARGLPV
ncbi:ubiquinone biosynthesis protein UbiH [Hyphomicrobium methylovorum]|uniref:FAD-dependent monooxygenase n=1 Tax=Hyphomicrobium methylovorum TaxID=84 RepID=UPI0015E6A466|nr:ubiquinone biosynthesis protein UbiH [Hyphomicrobium methylovorum]